MIKNEKTIYKSGRKNETGYHFSIFTKKQRNLITYVLAFLVFACSVFVLDVTNSISINQLKNAFGAIDGVKPVNSDFAVYYLDVGQSDCTIVICDDEVLMIDCGTLNQLNTIRQSLLSLDIDKIDYMVISHQHDDHMGSAVEIINDYNVDNLIMPRLAQSNNVTSKTYNTFINTVNNKNITKIPAQDCKGFRIGDARVEIFSPNTQSNNLNNMSVVLKITYGETEFLFQGDSETKIENDLMRADYDIDVDVLKIGHHGSKTSTSSTYLEATSPQFAVISSGYGNNYGHPNGEILKRLDNSEITTLITSLDGDVVVTSNGEKITVSTQSS